jgi:hypothetical protein
MTRSVHRGKSNQNCPAPLSGPASRDSLTPALLRGSPLRAIPGPVRLNRHPCRCLLTKSPTAQYLRSAGHNRNRCRPCDLRTTDQLKSCGDSGESALQIAWAFRAAISQTPPNAPREAEWRCRGVGRSAWMPSERRWAMDGPSARAHTTAPERRNRREAGGRTPAQWFWLLLPKQK